MSLDHTLATAKFASLAYATVARIGSGTAHEMYVRYLARALVHSGSAITVCAPVYSNARLQLMRERPGSELWPIVFVSLGRGVQSKYAYLWYALRLFFVRFRTAAKPDLWITHHPMLALALCLRGAHWVYDVHQVDPRGRLLGRLLRHSTCKGIVFNSNAARKKMERLLDTTHLPTLVSHNAIDARLYCSAPSRMAARQLLALTEGKVIFMYVGSIGPGRGMEQIVSAAVTIEESLPGRCAWVIVGGEGPNYVTLQHLIKSASCGSYVSAVGSQAPVRLPTWYAAADCLLAPYSLRLPAADVMNPMKLYEYSAAGKPILVSDMPTTREALEGNDACIYFEPDSLQSMIASIERFLVEQEILTADAVSFRSKALCNTWDAKAATLIKWISEVCN